MYKLIVIDGIMGSGKSTTAKFVVDFLERERVSARLIDEGNEDHPIQMKDPEAYESIQAWMTERLLKWKNLTASILESDAVFVLDGQLFHECVDSMNKRLLGVPPSFGRRVRKFGLLYVHRICRVAWVQIKQANGQSVRVRCVEAPYV